MSFPESQDRAVDYRKDPGVKDSSKFSHAGNNLRTSDNRATKPYPKGPRVNETLVTRKPIPYHERSKYSLDAPAPTMLLSYIDVSLFVPNTLTNESKISSLPIPENVNKEIVRSLVLLFRLFQFYDFKPFCSTVNIPNFGSWWS